MSAYVPGVCNIGPAEIRRRRWIGLTALVFVAVWLGLSWLFHWPREVRALVGFPAGLAAIGFLQATMHFCAGFGVLGVRNLGDRAQQPESVPQADFRRKDRQKALQIIGIAGLVGLVSAALCWLV